METVFVKTTKSDGTIELRDFIAEEISRDPNEALKKMQAIEKENRRLLANFNGENLRYGRK